MTQHCEATGGELSGAASESAEPECSSIEECAGRRGLEILCNGDERVGESIWGVKIRALQRVWVYQRKQVNWSTG